VSTRQHVEQVSSDGRFVYAADAREPHSTRTLRLVRVLDVFVSFFFGGFLLVLGVGMCLQRVHSALAAQRLRCGMLIVAAAYVVGGVTDLLQCHFQAAGIGVHCNGNACFKVAASFLVCVAVMMLQTRLFIAFCLVLESAYRVWWLQREGTESSIGEWSLLVVGWIVVFAVYPLVVHFREMKRACDACAHRDAAHAAGAARDEPAQHAAQHVLVRVLEHGDDDKQSGSGDEPCTRAPPCVQVKEESVQELERVKEDCARVKVGAPSDVRNAASELVRAALPIFQHEVQGVVPRPSSTSDDTSAGAPSGSSPEPAEGNPRPCMVGWHPGSSPESTEEKVLPCMSGWLAGKGELASALETDKASCQAERKRKRRAAQNQLIATLDSLLPDRARNKAFKGAVSVPPARPHPWSCLRSRAPRWRTAGRRTRTSSVVSIVVSIVAGPQLTPCCLPCACGLLTRGVARMWQGPRSSGIRGRSFFNVMTDSISYMQGLGLPRKGDAARRAHAAHTASGGASVLNGMGLSFEEMLLHSQTMVVMQVELVGQDLWVSSNAVSRATQDFFADAPFSIGGKRLRDLVCSLNCVCLAGAVRSRMLVLRCQGVEAFGVCRGRCVGLMVDIRLETCVC